MITGFFVFCGPRCSCYIQRFCVYPFRGQSHARIRRTEVGIGVRNAKTGPKPYLLSDGQGLSLRIRPNGAKTWLLRYRRPGTGKENFLSLGPYPDISLIEAWRRAATARDLVREGTGPVEQ